MFRVASVCLILALATGFDRAVAEPSGIVIAVVQSAAVDAATGRKILQPEAPVFSGDSIVTGGVGEAQIRFRDNTKLVVGPNSRMVIDAFVFNDDNTARKFTINIAKGAFRFITGNSSKDAYTINTPTATIGVRGTVFDLNVGQETRLLNIEGTTRQCELPLPGQVPNPANCVETSDSCGISVSRSGRRVEQLKYLPEVVRSLDLYFKYEHDQSALHKEFRADTSRCEEIRQLVRLKFSPEPVSPN